MNVITPGQIALVGEHLQVEHQPRVLLERRGHARRLVEDRQFASALRFGVLNPAFDVADRLEVLAQLCAVARPEPLPQAGYLGVDRVEDAAVLLHARQPHARIRAATVPEHPLEDDARIVLHRQRRGRTAPRDRVRVGAAEAAVAGARADISGLHRQLQRSELRVLPHLAGDQLIDGDLRVKVVAFLSERPRDRARQELRGASAMHGATLRGFAVAILRQSTDDRQLIPERLERLENLRVLEAGALGARRPFVDDHAVRQIDDAKPPDRIRRRATERGESRDHAIE